MGYSHFDKLSGVNGLAVGAKGAEKVIADSLGRMYLNFEPGNQFYVDSVHGSTSNDGLTWASALAGIDAAVGKCTANHGDVIWVAPGHNEGIVAASAIDLDIAGITVIGLGTGTLKPTIDFDHADAGFVIGADNVTVKNIRFRCSVTSVKIGVAIEAAVDSYQILDCDFGWAEAAGTDEFLIAVNILAACNDGLIEGCTFAAGAAEATVAVKLVGASDNVTIRNNRFTGACSTAFVNGITTLSTNLLIQGNIMQQGATEPGIELLTGTTGVICDNYIATNLDTVTASIVADGCWKFENYYCEVGNETGALIGTASAND